MRRTWMLLLLLACTLAGAEDAAEVAQSTRPRDLQPEATAGEIANVASSVNKFTFTMLRSQVQGDDNLCVCPFSIWQALAMASAGARGTTAAEFIRTLNVPYEPERFHRAVNALSLQLASRNTPAEGAPGYKLALANALWGQKGKMWVSSFLGTLSINYGAGIRVVDYRNDADGARATINGWVEQQTNAKIKELIPPGGLSGATRLLLTNAVYCAAPWASPFAKDATADDDWEMINSRKFKVPFMHLNATLPHAKNELWELVELPYAGGQLVMDVLSCDSQIFRERHSGCTPEVYNRLVAGLKPTNVDLMLPKFTVGTSLRLKLLLSRLGLSSAFSFSADFSGMDGNRELSLSDVLHKTWIKVDEAGTEAAAATGVSVAVTSVGAEPVKVRCNHPFLYVVRDVPTGVVLFVGRVLDPRP